MPNHTPTTWLATTPYQRKYHPDPDKYVLTISLINVLNWLILIMHVWVIFNHFLFKSYSFIFIYLFILIYIFYSYILLFTNIFYLLNLQKKTKRKFCKSNLLSLYVFWYEWNDSWVFAFSFTSNARAKFYVLNMCNMY